MADIVTANYSFVLPEVGGSDDTWGNKLNANWSSLETRFSGTFDAPAAGHLGTIKSARLPNTITGARTFSGKVTLSGGVAGNTTFDNDIIAGDSARVRLRGGSMSELRTSLKISNEVGSANDVLRFDLQDTTNVADISVVSVNDANLQAVRFGRSSPSGIQKIVLLNPGTTTPRVTLSSENNGSVEAGTGIFQGIVVGGANAINSNSFIDINPTASAGIRVARNSDAVSRLMLLEAGTTNTRIDIDATTAAAFVKAPIGDFGDYYVGALPDGTLLQLYLSAKSGKTLNFRSGVTSSNNLGTIRGSDNVVALTFGPAGTVLGTGTTVVTREKGDARYRNASNLDSGTVPTARLPTIPASNLPTDNAARNWVGSRIAAMAVGAVGTYGFFRCEAASRPVNTGDTRPGSVLSYSHSNGGIGGSPSGTWRCMGVIGGSDNSTVFLRIS